MYMWIPAWRYSQNIIKYRIIPPSLFTIHYSVFQDYNSLVNYFKNNPDNRYADSTWCVGKNGEWCCMVDPNHTPWTNGSGLGSYVDHNGNLSTLINDMALTVETSNDLKDGKYFIFTDAHYQTLADLFKWTLENYQYTHITRICGHEHLVPQYKIDPGVLFDWEKFLVNFVGMKKEIYNGYMKFLQDTANITGPNWWTGISSTNAERKKQICHSAELKIFRDLKMPSSYYMK